MISEGGLYRLLCRSRKPEAIRFERWVFDELLPTLRETGQHKLSDEVAAMRNQLAIKVEQLTIKDEQLDIKDEQLAIKEEKISEFCEKVAVMTRNNKQKLVFQLYKHQTTNECILIRTQSKSLSQAMKSIDQEIYELLMNEVNVPNSIDILNRLKEKLVELEISFKASANKLTADADVPEILSDLIEESRT
jgi:preprotein translocase subunit SecD